MAVAIEVSFLSATQKLTNADQGRVLTFVNKFLENPAHPSLSLERVQQARSDDVWSARVSRDMRAILFRDGADCVLVYVDRHDNAYQWASSRSIARHDLLAPCRSLNCRRSTLLAPLPCRRRGKGYSPHTLTAICTASVCHSSGCQQYGRSVRKTN